MSQEEESARRTAGSSTLIFNGTNGFLVQKTEYCGLRCTKMILWVGTNGTICMFIGDSTDHFN
jgi:hypothetical protein